MKLIRQAFVLECVTIAWMVLEAVVAIGSGIAAHSVTLFAFGIDSLIELLSAGVLLWRLDAEIRRGQDFSNIVEERASRIAGLLLLVLAAYVLVSGGWSLWNRHGESFSVPGLVLTVIAIPVMLVLARAKMRIAKLIESHALWADAIESIACGWLSVVVFVGLLTQLAFPGWWWIDGAASLVLVWFLVREGREAWEGNACCADSR
jgi:divalent metal cation (Fe/Co/Zn/Cd) transporter